MRVSSYFLPVTALALLALGCASRTSGEPTSAPATKAVEKANPAVVNLQSSNVTRLYQDNCANCHGQNGEGGGAGTQTLLTKELYSQDKDIPFYEAIKNGVANQAMPSYGDSLSPEQMWSLVVHVRELQKRALGGELGVARQNDTYTTSSGVKYKLEVVARMPQGMKTPWAIDWLPTGEALVTNRNGVLAIVKNGAVVGQVRGIPKSVENGQGGLMDVAVHPKYSENGFIYLSFSDPKQNNPREQATKVVRGRIEMVGNDANWVEQETILRLPQDRYNGSGLHFGSRIVFDGKGYVFISLGERGNGPLAQEKNQPNGKVLRLHEDGKVPADNPFAGQGEIASMVWSYGHRNPQGLTMDANGNLWDTEHGPRGGDEVNKIEKGKNYGWPNIAFSINYNDTPYKTPWADGYTMPVFRWLPSIGACGLDTVRGNQFAGWKGDLIAGGLAGQTVDRIRVANGKLVENETIFNGHGRVRDVQCGPDGLIYVVLNGPDQVVRMVPIR